MYLMSHCLHVQEAFVTHDDNFGYGDEDQLDGDDHDDDHDDDSDDTSESVSHHGSYKYKWFCIVIFMAWSLRID